MSVSLVALALSFIALAALSPLFEYEAPAAGRPMPLIVLLLVVAGAAYLLVVREVLCASGAAIPMRGIILIGLCMRAAMMPSAPIQEDDYYRYLWDGALVVHGWNPYEFVPQAIAHADQSIPEPVRELAAEARPVVERINHSWLRTIYPPTAQSAFAAAHLIRPWSLVALRLVWLALDLACVMLIVSVLRHLKLPGNRAAIWWLNPVLVKEIYNSGHMELTVVVFVLLALRFMLAARPVAACGALGLAAAAKVWPVLLLPLLVRAAPRDWRRFVAAMLFAMMAALCAAPVVTAGLDADSGFTAYAQRWEMNDLAYMAFDRVGRWIAGNDSGLGRILVMATVAAWVIWLIRKPVLGSHDLLRRAMLIAAATFLLSPTQMPWYYLWVLPLLVFCPRRGLLLYAVLLPLYYLRFPMVSLELTAWFDHGVVWLEHLPVWTVLIVDAVKSARRRAAAHSPGAPPVPQPTNVNSEPAA